MTRSILYQFILFVTISNQYGVHRLQVIGDGNRRMMTLAHRAQVRRFTSDLLRVLKSLASKQTTVAEFPSLFEKTLNRAFDPTDYGLCALEDLLAQVSENTIVISASPGSAENTEDPQEVVIAIPKREQTAEEIERTKNFANEVMIFHFYLNSLLYEKSGIQLYSRQIFLPCSIA